jgi:hypothetical protein
MSESKPSTAAFAAHAASMAHRINSAKTETTLLKAHKKEISKLLDLLGVSGENTNEYVSLDVWDAWSAHRVKPYVRIHLYELDSFKGAKLSAILWALANHGETEVKTTEFPNSINRDYNFDFANIRVQVCAFVGAESATCKRIKIGEKTQIVEEYAIQCD